MIGEGEKRIEGYCFFLCEGLAYRGGEIDSGNCESIAIKLSDARCDCGKWTKRFVIPRLGLNNRVEKRGDLLVAGKHGRFRDV